MPAILRGAPSMWHRADPERPRQRGALRHRSGPPPPGVGPPVEGSTPTRRTRFDDLPPLSTSGQDPWTTGRAHLLPGVPRRSQRTPGPATGPGHQTAEGPGPAAASVRARKGGTGRHGPRVRAPQDRGVGSGREADRLPACPGPGLTPVPAEQVPPPLPRSGGPTDAGRNRGTPPRRPSRLDAKKTEEARVGEEW